MLAAIVVITLVGWQWKWINSRFVAIANILMISALLLTQTRAGVLALVVAAIYLLGCRYYKLLFFVVLVCLLVVGITTSTRHIDNLPIIRQITSDRIHLWELSKQGISKKPLFGWGMDGFGTAYPYVINPKWVKIIYLDDSSFYYQRPDGVSGTFILPTVKAHNLILDTILSVGFLGMLPYLMGITFCFWQVSKSPYRGIEAVALTYIIFTLTWYECAQYTHIAWWALSFFNKNRRESHPFKE